VILLVGAVVGTVSLKAVAEIAIALVAGVLVLKVLVLHGLSNALPIAEVKGVSVSEDRSRKSAGDSQKCCGSCSSCKSRAMAAN